MKELDFALIGKKIKEVRTSKKLTQEFIADITGVNVSHISNIETNKVKVSLSLLVQICNALDITVDYILEKEYRNPAIAVETELFHTIKDMDKEKRIFFFGSRKFSNNTKEMRNQSISSPSTLKIRVGYTSINLPCYGAYIYNP